MPRAPSAATLLIFLPVVAACAPEPTDTVDEARLVELRAELEERFTPGLHSLMIELGMRHATLWFAGEAANWGLADYLIHEMEELLEEIEAVHPVYRDVQVALLLREMTHPAVEALTAAVEEGDRAAFASAFDQLTVACNSCHLASDRGAIVIQRPTAPPYTNLRFPP